MSVRPEEAHPNPGVNAKDSLGAVIELDVALINDLESAWKGRSFVPTSIQARTENSMC